jgi:Epoxide hydrolase N terminus
MTNGFATPYDLLTFQKRCFPNELIDIDRTPESWVKRKAPTS